MRKIIFLFFYFLVTFSVAHGQEMRKINIFYDYERGDSAINQLFRNVDSLLTVVKVDPIVPDGTTSIQVTLETVVAMKANGETFFYEKSYVIGKGHSRGADLVFFSETYPTNIGSQFKNDNRSIFASIISNFLITTRNGYLTGRATNQGIKN